MHAGAGGRGGAVQARPGCSSAAGRTIPGRPLQRRSCPSGARQRVAGAAAADERSAEQNQPAAPRGDAALCGSCGAAADVRPRPDLQIPAYSWEGKA